MTQRVVMVDKTVPFEGPHWDRLVQAIGSDQMVVVDPRDASAVDRVLQSAEIAILAGDLDERFVSAPKLKWIHCDHAGLTKSARPAVFERGLIVTGSAGRSGPALAEHVMMFALMLCSRYPDLYEAQKRQEWFRTPSMFDLRALYGRTIGILGMGHTGVELAKRAKAFNMKVLGYRRRDMPKPEGVDEIFSTDKGEGTETILERADILALVLNLSDATHHLIDKAAIARMKRGSIIINLARGGVIEQDALIDALKSGHLAGAGLDVTDPEPLPSGHPLWTTPNVLITPHFTAAVPDKVDRSLDVISENFKRYRVGEPMLNRMTAEDLWTRGA